MSVEDNDGTEFDTQENLRLSTEVIRYASSTAEIDGKAATYDLINSEEEAYEAVNLAASLMEKCKADLSLSNLDTAIVLFRQVFEGRPTTHPFHTEAMKDLASSLSIRFMYTNRIHDLAEYTTLQVKIRQNSISDEDKSHNIIAAARQGYDTHENDTTELAKELLKDFRQSVSLHILNTIIFLGELSLPFLPPESPSGIGALNTLVDALYARFNHFQDRSDSDLNAAISILQDGIRGRAQRDIQQSNMDSRLSGLLAERFNLLGNITDLETILVWLEITNVEGSNTLAPVIRKLQLANALREQFSRSGNVGDLDTAITLSREGITELPQGSENYAVGLTHLALALVTRSQQEGQQMDVNEAISLHRKAVDIFLPPHPNRAESLNNLANALRVRSKRGGGLNDLNEAISLHTEALKLQIPPHPDRSDSLNNLAAALWTRFDLQGELADLDDAVSLHRQALELRMPPHRHRSDSLYNLAAALASRFEQRGQQSDLDDSISFHRQALELLIPPHPLRSSTLNNLATSLAIRFEQGGQRVDIDEAISLHRQALELFPPTHPDRSGSLSNLAAALLTRLRRGGEQSDLDEAISLHRKAMDIQLSHRPLSKSPSNLANALSVRFQRGGQRSDLNEAISLHRQALKIITPSHPDRSLALYNLASALLVQFEEEEEPSVLEEVISLYRQTLELRAPPHPNRSHSLANLAYALVIRYDQLGGQQSDLDEAMNLFSTASEYPFQSSSYRLGVAGTWIRHADLTGHVSTISAYEAALQALPQVASLNLDIESRQKALTVGSDGLARDASRCAIRSKRLDKAVELLEAGRSVFWSQILSLRSPFHQLRKIEPNGPELADRLQDIANALDVGSHRDVSAHILDNQKRLSIDQEASRMNRLNEEWAATILEVRRSTGLEDFLRPPRLSSLINAASNHPIIILVANDDGSHCLIMTLTVIHHIPLRNLRTPILKILVDNIRVAVSQSHITRSFLDESRQAIVELLGEKRGISYQNDSQNSDGIFRFVLRILWDELVKPVIDFLDIKKLSDQNSVLHWCPTGYFTFLPIHAAGSYNDNENVTHDCSTDYFISSYTPTIGTLLPQPSAPAPQTFQMMAVIQSQELHSTKDELNKIRQHVPGDVLIELGTPGSPAGVEDVATRLSSVSLVHFACHGTQDPFKPLDSGLKLDDGLLRISRIMKEKMPSGSLAFLCACETAMGDETLPDEAMSIGASLLFSGFQRVVATMWSMKDEDGPAIADAFYRELFRGPDGKKALVPDVTKSAYALHNAVKELRSKNVAFRQWVPFIHMGK